MICIHLIKEQVIKCKRYFYAQPEPASAVTAATMSSSNVLVPGLVYKEDDVVYIKNKYSIMGTYFNSLRCIRIAA